MNWMEPQDGIQCSSCGYRIVAVRVRDTWRFSAFSPVQSPELNYWQWLERAHARIAYDLGSHVPVRQPLLGVFPSASQARGCCEDYANHQDAPHG